MSTPPTANGTIVVNMGRPEADVEADGFEPRNALLRSPKHVTKPPPPADPNVQRDSSKLSTCDNPGLLYTGDGTNSEIDMEPTIENTLKVMQSVHELLHQKVLRSDQKNDARNKVAWAIEQITAMIAPKERLPTADNTDMNNIANDIQDIKVALKEALAPKALAWTQAIPRAPTQTQTPAVAQAGTNRRGGVPESTRKERLEKL